MSPNGVRLERDNQSIASLIHGMNGLIMVLKCYRQIFNRDNPSKLIRKYQKLKARQYFSFQVI